jgi:hypothetical protein
MNKFIFMVIAWLFTLSPVFADQVPHPTNGPSSSTVGHYATFNNTTGNQLVDSGVASSTLTGKLVPFTDVGLVCNDSSDESTALQTAINNAATNGYTLVGAPGMICKVSQNITVSAFSSIQGNGIIFDCTANANSTGDCVLLNSATVPSAYSQSAPPGWSGVTLWGPAYAGKTVNYSSTTTLDGIGFTGTSSYQLANLLMTNLTVVGFYDNIDFTGSSGNNQQYVYIIKFLNSKSYNCLDYGVNFGSTVTSGENISFIGGVFGNCHNYNTNAAGAVYLNSSGFDVQFDHVSFDYSDWLIRVNYGTAHFSHDHFESSCAHSSNGVQPVTNCNPFIWAGTGGNVTITVADSEFYQPVGGIAGGGVAEISGGRPFMVQGTGAWNTFIFSGDTLWSAGGDNHLTTFFKGNGNQRISVAHLDTGNGGNPNSYFPSLGNASPTYVAGNFTNYAYNNALSGWSQNETNYYRNSGFAGAVAGTPGTLPTGWSFGNLQGLNQQVLGVSYATGRPQLQIRLYGTASTTGNITLKQDTPNYPTLQTQQYDNWIFSEGVQLIANPGVNLPTIQMGYQGFASDNVTSSEAGTTPASTLSFTRQVLAAPINITTATTATLFPYTPIQVNSSTTYDFTLGFDLPELTQVGSPVSNMVGSGQPAGALPALPVGTTPFAEINNGVAPVEYGNYGLNLAGTVTGTSASSSGTTVTYTAGTGTFAQGQIVNVTGGTGTLPAGTYIQNIISGTQFTLSSTPTVALSSATISGNMCNVLPGVTPTNNQCLAMWNKGILATGTSASSSGTTVTYTAGTGLFAVGQSVSVTGGTGTITAGTTIVSITDATHFVLSAAPSVTLSAASIQANPGPTNGPYFSLPVQGGNWVYGKAYVSIPTGSVTNGYASLYYIPYDSTGKALTGGVIGNPVVCVSAPCSFTQGSYTNVAGWVYMPPNAVSVHVYPYLAAGFQGTAIFDHVEAGVE